MKNKQQRNTLQQISTKTLTSTLTRVGHKNSGGRPGKRNQIKNGPVGSPICFSDSNLNLIVITDFKVDERIK